MSWLHALILGFVQGCTEFFPISSSAHLKIVKSWLHISSGEETLFFDLACHVGTLITLVIYFRKDLWELIFNPKKLFPYMIALAPLLPVYFLLTPVRIWASQPHLLGISLFITALLLFVAQKTKRGVVETPTWKDALWIGAAQSVALVPGISRSASTITGGIRRGLSTRKAVRFSFILSIPAVAGGALLEVLKISSHTPISLSSCAIGLATSALVGLGAVRIAIPFLEKGMFRPLAWYCLIVALLLTVGR